MLFASELNSGSQLERTFTQSNDIPAPEDLRFYVFSGEKNAVSIPSPFELHYVPSPPPAPQATKISPQKRKNLNSTLPLIFTLFKKWGSNTVECIETFLMFLNSILLLLVCFLFSNFLSLLNGFIVLCYTKILSNKVGKKKVSEICIYEKNHDLY